MAAIRKLAIRYSRKSSRSASSFKPAKKKKILDLTSGTYKWPGGGRGNGIIKGKRKKTQQQGRHNTFSF